MTEAGGGSPTAIDRNEEQPVAPPLIGRIDRSTLSAIPTEKDPILDGQRRQVAAPHPDHRQGPLRQRERTLLPNLPDPLEPGDRLAGRKKKVLQRMGADDVIERPGGLIAVEPVVPPLLLVDPAGGEIIAPSATVGPMTRYSTASTSISR